MNIFINALLEQLLAYSIWFAWFVPLIEWLS